MEYTDNRLPESWVETRLGKVLDYGKTRKVEPAHMQPDNWVLELEDIEKDSSKLLGKWTVRDRQPKSSKNRFAKGDVLYGKLRPYLNKVIVADEDGICTTEIIPLSGNEHIHNRYLFYWLKSSRFVQYATQASYGMNMPRLGTQDGRNAPLILPPLPEQHYIAERLDSLMARADAAQARLQGLPLQLKHYRQAVLAAAVSGDLTADWREQTGCLKEWELVSLEDVLVSAINGISKRKGNEGVETTVLRLADFNNATRQYGNERTILLTEKELLKYGLIENDILIVRVNGSVSLAGRFIEYKGTDKTECFCDHFIRLRMNKQKISARYLTYIANAGEGRQYLESSLSTSAGQNTINQTAIKRLQFLLPTLPEQTEIVRRVEKLLAHAEHIEQAVNHSLQQLALLKQSLLARAFSGELSAAWRTR